MRLTMLGTGSADGWPNPFCECESCETERRAGRSRRPASALIDDVLLVDCGPAATHAASAAGTALACVEHVLITHGHPDHLDPAFLLARHWSQLRSLLHVWGPARALDLCRDWIGPADPISLHPVSSGDRVVMDSVRGQYRATVLPAAHTSGNGDRLAEEAVLFDITDPDGQRLVYATDTGPISEQATDLIGGPIDILVLDETFGTCMDHGTGHLDFDTFASTVKALRVLGLVGDATQVIATHLSHHNPPGPELDLQLRASGARAASDLEVIESPAIPRLPRSLFILGGARSGKSTHAERMAALWSDEVTYVATSGEQKDDPEWTARVTEHRARRPRSWSTIETSDVTAVIDSATAGSVILIDCLTLWLTGVMDELDAWNRIDGDDLQDAVMQWVRALADSIRDCPAEVIVVSNEVGQGVVPATTSGRLFRDLMGKANSVMADACDSSVFVVAGRSIPMHSLQPTSSEDQP